MTTHTHLLSRSPAVAVVLTALAALLPAAASGAKGQAPVITWQKPTPVDGKRLKVAAGTTVTFSLAASVAGTAASIPGNVLPIQIALAELPAGARFVPNPGTRATARFSWTPTASQAGEHVLTFSASAAGLTSPTARAIVIQVLTAKKTLLSDSAAESYKWAFVTRKTVVRSAPSARSRSVAKPLSKTTPEYFPNLVQTLQSIRYPNGETWVQVRLASLPNSKLGWVRRGALGRFRTVRTRLVVSIGGLRATLYRGGKPIFRTVVGVGQSRWPTPRGDFYVREVLTGYNMPAYGPVAFGISARSNVLTGWKGGGFIGIHGTNAPGILPGRVSHGCIRMRNSAVLRLKRLMPLGTPVQVR